jgi:hypothetical protein
MSTEKSKEKYFNFPIQLLEGFIMNSNKVLTNISNYSIYEHTLKLEFGTDLQKMKDSASFYNMTLGSVKNSLGSGKMLHESIPTNSPKVGLNLSIFWDFYTNEKTEFDKVCLLAFLGIKSILGKQSYCKATNLFLWSRMDGKTNAIVEVLTLSNEVRKYANEYQTKKIKTALRNNWGLVTYARHTRGFYVSFILDLKKLITEAEKRRISTKEKQYKEKEKQLLKEVLEQLKSTRPT